MDLNVGLINKLMDSGKKKKRAFYMFAKGGGPRAPRSRDINGLSFSFRIVDGTEKEFLQGT